MASMRGYFLNPSKARLIRGSLNYEVKHAAIDKDENLYLCFDNASITTIENEIFFVANNPLINKHSTKSKNNYVSIKIPRSRMSSKVKSSIEHIYIPTKLIEKGCDFNGDPIPVNNIEAYDSKSIIQDELKYSFINNGGKRYSIFNIQKNNMSKLLGFTKFSYLNKKDEIIEEPVVAFDIYARTVNDKKTTNSQKVIGAALFPFTIIIDIVTIPIQAIVFLMLISSAH